MTSSQTNQESALAELLGGKIEHKPIVDEGDLAVALLVASVRGQLNEAVKAEKIGVRDLARALCISPAAVSRQLRAEGDMRLSTAAAFANVLDKEWRVTLADRRPKGEMHNASWRGSTVYSLPVTRCEASSKSTANVPIAQEQRNIIVKVTQ